METENDGPHLRHCRVLRRNRPVKTLDDTVSINVTDEVFWIAGSDERNAVRTIIVKGKITELDKTYPVEWKWQVDGAFKKFLSVAIETLEDTSSSFETIVPEREMWANVSDWSRIGLMFIGSKFSHLYIEFTKDDKKLRAKLESTHELEEFASFIYS